MKPPLEARAHRDNRTGRLGVYRQEGRRRFRAEVMHNGKRHHVGMFDTVAEAAEAARAKRLELFTHNEIDNSHAPRNECERTRNGEGTHYGRTKEIGRKWNTTPRGHHLAPEIALAGWLPRPTPNS